VSRDRKYERRDAERSVTLTVKDLKRLADEPYDARELEASRPRTRGDCKDAARPCPWAGCSHHLALDVNPDTGAIKFNYPDLEIWEMRETCSLDVADRGGVTLEEVGDICRITRERIRQIEVRGLIKLKMLGDELE